VAAKLASGLGRLATFVDVGQVAVFELFFGIGWIIAFARQYIGGIGIYAFFPGDGESSEREKISGHGEKLKLFFWPARTTIIT
jgi:hypothetical protein